MARSISEKSSKSALSAAMKTLALTVLALAYAAAPAHAQQCGRQARGRLCPNGLCCSEYGYCGTSSAYCGRGCQSQCRVNANDAEPVQAPQCGAQARGRLCPNGLCCSEYGYCGTTNAYCGRGCQSQCRMNGVAVDAAPAPVLAPQCGRQARGRRCPNGLCCSQFGYCGSNNEYCGTGCQSQCRVNAAPVQAPQCGRQARGRRCPNGLCCSQFGYCGTSNEYCGTGCQSQCRVNGNDTAPVQAPQCGAQARGRLCRDGLCCSEFGYCGITSAYCGRGCQSQCRVNVDGSGVASIVTQELFDQMLPRGDDEACPDREFYTYDAFLAAASAFPAFGATGDEDARKREVAAFMAQAASSGDSFSGGFCYRDASGATSHYCTPNTQYPCAPNKTYHARGPIQLSYNYNYGMASQAIAEDLLRNPELVATDPVVAFKTALWLWMGPGDWNHPSCHAVITGLWAATPPHQAAGRVPGFGLTTNILTGGRRCAAEDGGRVGLYKRFCDLLGVGHGPNLDCRGQVPFDGEIEAPAK